jgi:hypothetical protein
VPSDAAACTAACTGSTENASAKHAETVEPNADFAAAVVGIMALPLTDSERAECIRRLLAVQTKTN